MAYVQVQTLVDTPMRYVTKRVNSGNTESNTLVANAAALAFATVALTTVASANNFKVGETVTAQAGGTAIVQDVINSTAVMLSNVSGTFTTAQTVTGDVSGKIRTQNGSLANSTYDLQVARIIFNISAGSAVSLEWEGEGGSANNRTVAILAGSGEMLLDSWGMRSNNTAVSPTGNLILNTLQWTANAHYTLLVDVSKGEGYAYPHYERNQTLGY